MQVCDFHIKKTDFQGPNSAIEAKNSHLLKLMFVPNPKTIKSVPFSLIIVIGPIDEIPLRL